VAFQYLKGAYWKDGENIFSRACCNRIRSNGFKLREGRFILDIRKTFFIIKVVKHWHRLPRELVEGEVGWCSEQPGLVEDSPAHCRGAQLDDL